jgi:hypothetical protein
MAKPSTAPSGVQMMMRAMGIDLGAIEEQAKQFVTAFATKLDAIEANQQEILRLLRGNDAKRIDAGSNRVSTSPGGCSEGGHNGTGTER